MKLTTSIFEYWYHWMSLPNDTIDFSNSCNDEGLFYYDGYHSTFWYLLNLEWYRMNNKMYASLTHRDYFNPDNRFIEPYWNEEEI